MWKEIYEKNWGKKGVGRWACARTRSGGTACQCPAGQSDIGSSTPHKRVCPLPCPSQEDTPGWPLLQGHFQEIRAGPWFPFTLFPPSSSSFSLSQTPHGARPWFPSPPLLALSLLHFLPQISFLISQGDLLLPCSPFRAAQHPRGWPGWSRVG